MARRGGARRPRERLITVVVACPDCGFEADPAMGGNHGGQCVTDLNVRDQGGRDAKKEAR